MGAVTTSVVAIAGVILGWITIEIACKPCLEKGREAIDRSLDPNYDPDEASLVAPPPQQILRRPLLSDPNATDPSASPDGAAPSAAPSTKLVE